MASHGSKMTSNLTMPPKDYLTPIPPELIHLIIGTLLPNHEPDIAFTDRSHIDGDTPHPIAALAATCTKLRAECNQWAHHFFKQHATITKYKPVKKTKTQTAPASPKNYIHGRNGLIAWIGKHCVFCGKKSVRTAILANGLHCCSACDRKEWPDKITKSKAKEEFDLRDSHLFPKHQPFIAKLSRATTIPLYPRLRYGTYISLNVATTMFVRAEVEALAEFVHGDVRAHMEAKKEAKAERTKRLVEKAMAKAKRVDEVDEEWERIHTPFQRAVRTKGSNQVAMEELTQLIRQHPGGVEGFLESDALKESLMRDTQEDCELFTER